VSEPEIETAMASVPAEGEARVVVQPVPARGDVMLRVSPDIAEDLLTGLRTHGVDASRALEHSVVADATFLVSVIGAFGAGLAKALQGIAKIRETRRIHVEFRDLKIDAASAREAKIALEALAQVPSVQVQCIDLPDNGQEPPRSAAALGPAGEMSDS
jgi:hypothetical protein